MSLAAFGAVVASRLLCREPGMGLVDRCHHAASAVELTGTPNRVAIHIGEGHRYTERAYP